MSQVAETLYVLRDIHLPQSVNGWPPAPGWLGLAVLLFIGLMLGLWGVYRHYQHRRRKQRIWQQFFELEQAYQQQTLPPQQIMIRLSILLRRLALRCYPRRQIAGLIGSAWLQFLDQTLNDDQVFSQQAQVLISAPYQAQVTDSLQPVFDLCRRWIQQHV
ncbi:MAG: DUF4381 family protein [Legionellales bacterium]|nr:DUF4381 family protein [Legionellales bacterium]